MDICANSFGMTSLMGDTSANNLKSMNTSSDNIQKQDGHELLYAGKHRDVQDELTSSNLQICKRHYPHITDNMMETRRNGWTWVGIRRPTQI